MKLFYIFMVISAMTLIGKTLPRHIPSLFGTAFLQKRTTRGTLTLGIMWNFITTHFTVLKCCAPSVTAELFNGRNSIKLLARANLRIVWQH